MFGKEAKKKELINNLHVIYEQIQRQHLISLGDFPNLKHLQEQLEKEDFNKFHSMKPKLIEAVDEMLRVDVARLMVMIPHEQQVISTEPVVKGGAFEVYNDSPFGIGKGEGIDKGREDEEWIVGKDRYKFDAAFESLGPVNGKISGTVARNEMMKSHLPNSVLGKVWKLADLDKDGMLDADEFALAMYLIKLKLDGVELPTELPPHLLPPGRRGFSD